MRPKAIRPFAEGGISCSERMCLDRFSSGSADRRTSHAGGRLLQGVVTSWECTHLFDASGRQSGHVDEQPGLHTPRISSSAAEAVGHSFRDFSSVHSGSSVMSIVALLGAPAANSSSTPTAEQICTAWSNRIADLSCSMKVRCIGWVAAPRSVPWSAPNPSRRRRVAGRVVACDR